MIVNKKKDKCPPQNSLDKPRENAIDEKINTLSLMVQTSFVDEKKSKS